MDELPVSTLVAVAAFVIGLLFGILTHRTNFCTMGSISDAVSFSDFRRARAWILATGTSVIGGQLLQHFGYVDLSQSIYLSANLNWLGAVVGGLIFGFGMVLSSGCPGRNLVRTGSGDLRALVVLIVAGLFAYMSLRGLIGMGRVEFEQATALDLAAIGASGQGIDTILAAVLGGAPEIWRLAVAALFVVGIFIVCFKDQAFRSSPPHIIAGLGLGILVTGGWWATGILGADDFEPTQLASLTFVAPTGNALQYLMTFSGATINFGIALVGGAIAGAFGSALIAKKFAWSGFFDTADTARHLVGAAMMGTGGVLALGCTIGQCITGLSTLAIGSVIAAIAIVTGGVLGIKYMERTLDI